jgi:hypothetical protein
MIRCGDNAVGITAGYEFDGRSSIPGRGKIFLFSTGCRPALGPPASSPMGTGSKAAGAWSWPLTSIWCRGQEGWRYSSTPPYVFMAYIYLSVCSCCSHFEHRASVKHFVSLQFLNLRQSVGLLGRGSARLKTATYTQIQNKRRQTCVEWDSNPRSQCSSGRGHFMP